MDKLGIKSKKEFVKLCGCKDVQQFYRWEKKGRMPMLRLAILKEELTRYWREEFNRKCRILDE